MEMLTIIYIIASAIGLGLIIWGKYTKSGRRWIKGEY